ncbi:MAG: hypothetical protein AAF682_11890, partial [Planctomycetota bacterium]
RTLGLAAAAGAYGGPAAAGAVLAGSRRPGDNGGSGYDSNWYWGYGSYPWWNFGYGSGWGGLGFGWYGCGYFSPSWYWSSYWACGWYPWYCYGSQFFFPNFCTPFTYFPAYYSTVVHHVYEEDDDNVIIINQAANEPVGEVVASGTPIDSELRTSLNAAAERYLTLGDRAFREGRFADAAQFYAKAVEFAPDEGVLHLVLSDALFATGDYHYAAYSVRRALELDPALADGIVDKHEFYADPADFDRHLSRAELFLAENPSDSDARLVLALNYLFGNRPAAAVDLLEGSFSLSVRADTASSLILESARRVQYGASAAPTPEAR